MNAPRATYRLQLRASFGFNQAAAVAPYLGQLGVSHVYLSPIFKARPGSVHGYDITDHANSIRNWEPRPTTGRHRAFRREGLGRILDVVPNHMGVRGADNPLWLDVLEWGPYSRYADWSDIDRSAQDGKLLTPVLGAQYAKTEIGQAKLRFEDDGSFAISAYDAHNSSIDPLTFPRILVTRTPRWTGWPTCLSIFPNGARKWRRSARFEDRAAPGEARQQHPRGDLTPSSSSSTATGANLIRLSERGSGASRLHRVAEDEINYRRFYEHQRPRRVCASRLARNRPRARPNISHARKRRDRWPTPRSTSMGCSIPKPISRRSSRARPAVHLVVEKILATHESLRADWPVEGTTGYRLHQPAPGVLVDPEWARLDQAHHDRRRGPGFATVRDGELRIMENEMASELNALGRRAAQLAGESSR